MKVSNNLSVKNIFVRILVSVITYCLLSSNTFAVGTANAGVYYPQNHLDTLNYKISSVPRIYITTEDGKGNELEKYVIDENGEEKKSPYTTGTHIVIIDENGEVFEDIGGIRVRGNTTAYGLKKPYNMKLSAESELLGMGKYKTWVLLANFFDPTLLRNYLAFELGRELNLEYTPDQRVVELWLDGVFKGTYTLMEKIDKEVDVNIEAGEFLIEGVYGTDEVNTNYITTKEFGIAFELSNPDDATDEQKNKILDVLDNAEKALISGDYNEVREIVDVESFAKYYLLNEYWKSGDTALGGSVFLYYKDGKLHAGPIWDFDLSAGNVSTIFSDYYNGTDSWNGAYITSLFYISDLLKYEDFYNKVTEEYEANKSYMKSIYETLIDETAEKYKATFDLNFTSTEEGGAGWDETYESHYIDMMYHSNGDCVGAYTENVEFFKKWLENRYKWMEENLSEELEKLVVYHSAEVSISDFEVSINEKEFTYDGKEKRPEVTVKSGDSYLNQDIDYTLTYSNNINVGEATVTITGTGSYTGTVTKTFTINKADSNNIADLDGNNKLNSNDAIWLYDHMIYEAVKNNVEKYDFNGDGAVNRDDASYLLLCVLIPETYQLKNQK